MFEHDMFESGAYMLNGTVPILWPYGVFKARVLEFFGGLESKQTLHFLAAPMLYHSAVIKRVPRNSSWNAERNESAKSVQYLVAAHAHGLVND